MWASEERILEAFLDHIFAMTHREEVKLVTKEWPNEIVQLNLTSNRAKHFICSLKYFHSFLLSL